MLIGAGLAVCYSANVWNIGAEGQFIVGALLAGMIPVYFTSWQTPEVMVVMLALGMLGGMAWARDPGLAQEPLQHQRDPDLADAGLCGAISLRLAGARAVARSAGVQLPEVRQLRWLATAAALGRHSPGRALRADRGARPLRHDGADAEGLRAAGAGCSAPRAGRFAGFSGPTRRDVLLPAAAARSQALRGRAT